MKRHTFGRRLGSLVIEIYNLIQHRESWYQIKTLLELDFENYDILRYHSRQNYLDHVNLMYAFLNECRFSTYCQEQVAAAFSA